MILTAAAFITKILSAIYRVPFQNIVGDVGFYIYQQIYPIYGIALALSTYGFPVIISRLIAQNEVDQDVKKMKEMIQTAFLFLAAVGIALFIVFYFGSSSLAKVMGDSKLTPLIKIISISFLLLPFLSVFRGYFQGIGNMFPTAVSQVIEQIVRVATILLFSTVLIRSGKSLYITGGGAMFGSLTGGISAILVLFTFVWVKRNTDIFSLRSKPFHIHWSWGKMLLFQGASICISGMLLILLQMVDSLSLYSTLIKHGIAELEAKQIKGIYDRGQPLVQLGTVVATSLSLTLVPLVTSAYKKGDGEAVKAKVTIAWKISIVVGLAATVGLMMLLEPVNTMLFENSDGTAVLRIFSLSILFTSMILTLLGILQGLGYSYAPTKYILLGIVVKYVGNVIFASAFGTRGAAFATVFALSVIVVLLVLKMKSIFGQSFASPVFYVKTGISVLLMMAVLRLWLWAASPLQSLFESERVFSVLLSFGGVLIGGAVYVYVIIRRSILAEEELLLLPLGSKLLSIQTRKKR
ncbi:polysaccharide biosynthesis protein [Falsibacillus albus]|uniref:Polysaccharide biosynthesis protein n=2 Tax=Falsibacillus albus TaxID=2478915 RepID=A0A3L7JML1_9BACI|nr:polysaccharide biosynthesis protein [Falsibacillus albus]